MRAVATIRDAYDNQAGRLVAADQELDVGKRRYELRLIVSIEQNQNRMTRGALGDTRQADRLLLARARPDDPF